MKGVLGVLSFLVSSNAWACPGCIGNTPNDNNVFIIIGIFVVACYIPMFIIYRTIFKNRNVNNRVP